jgi:hypothetical protein
MKIDVRTLLAGDALEEAWQLYETAFTTLNTLTIQRHLMYRSEFDDVAADPRIQKWLVFDGEGRLVGLAAYTNHLDAWTLISPEYFARRWPRQYAAKTIWYCGFVAAPYVVSGVFQLLVERMFRVVEEQDGVISLDFCRYNSRLATAVQLLMRRMSGGRCVSRSADEQQFWTYEPNGAPSTV